MITIVTQLLFSYLVSSCSDCFSNCPDSDKNGCLLACGCPIFTSSGVKGGVFTGATGQLYVPDVEQNLVEWVEVSMDCSLSCTEQCSLNYLDVNLELCVNACGCQELLKSQALSNEESLEASCSDLCKGSGSGCYSDCVEHFQLGGSNWYLWLWLPAVLIVFGAAFVVIQRKRKEDDYVLM